MLQLELFSRPRAPARVGLAFASLQSGSEGNATLVAAGGTTLLIDCGISPARLARRLAGFGRTVEGLSGVLVTHEHTDHAGGAGALARRFSVPLHMTEGTALEAARNILRRPVERDAVSFLPASRVLAWKDGALVDPGRPHDLKVEWIPVPHDGVEPVAFIVERGGVRAAVLTDVGHASREVGAVFETLDAVILEANHDRKRLDEGPYPSSLKRRIASRLGHLSNVEAARLVREHASPRLRHLVLGHLSRVNNAPGLAEAAVRKVLDRRRDLDMALHLAPPDRPGVLLDL